MSYFKILGFDKEPFSTSPDPDFFYSSRGHEAALTNALIELRLKRGLTVILGDVGTGKTTLSRKLIQELRGRQDCIFHMILDPSFENGLSFLNSFSRNLGVSIPETFTGDPLINFKEVLEHFLFQKAVVENKTVILIIDEAQKLNESTLEVLRVLLNYETNDFKLLQLVLLGQNELQAKIKAIPNFFDRISYKAKLYPLEYNEMKEMIFFRLKQAGYHSHMDLFLEEAFQVVFDYTAGHPRQVTMLCHRVLKELLLKSKMVADAHLVKGLIEEDRRSGWQRTSNLILQKNNY